MAAIVPRSTATEPPQPEMRVAETKHDPRMAAADNRPREHTTRIDAPIAFLKRCIRKPQTQSRRDPQGAATLHELRSRQCFLKRRRQGTPRQPNKLRESSESRGKR